MKSNKDFYSPRDILESGLKLGERYTLMFDPDTERTTVRRNFNNRFQRGWRAINAGRRNRKKLS